MVRAVGDVQKGTGLQQTGVFALFVPQLSESPGPVPLGLCQCDAPLGPYDLQCDLQMGQGLSGLLQFQIGDGKIIAEQADHMGILGFFRVCQKLQIGFYGFGISLQPLQNDGDLSQQ